MKLSPYSAIVAVLMAGCHAAPERTTGPYQELSESLRTTVVAEELNREAADLLYADPAQAEVLLRDALTADLYFGPAHNNLGVLFLEQGKLYEAANEFEWARKLMPGKADPRMNLALTLEVAGRAQEALREYQTAHEVDPDHVPTVQAMARLILSRDREDERLPKLLETIAMRGEPKWREWAERERVRR